MRETALLDLDDAWKVITYVRSGIDAHGGGAAVAVVDAHGELLAFARTHDCPLPSIDNAINKAFTAARERKESAEIGKAARAEGFPITNFGNLRYTGWGGGVPIVMEGVVVGAVGVSGLPEAVDVELAQRGAATLVGN